MPTTTGDKVVPIASGRRRFGLTAILLSVLIALIAGAVGGFGGYFLGARTRDALHRTDVSLPQGGVPANRPPNSVAGIAKRIGPAVVSLAVTSADKTQSGVGSGVVIDKHGYVLTNNHVAAVAKDGGTIVATFSNEASAKAEIVGLDPISDLAVLKVPDDQLTVAPLGKSSTLAVGDPVIAIGSPLGLNGTVTAGIVSALDRPVHVFGDNGQSDAYLDAVQTDAAINPGNSGGALVDAGGRLVGINSAAALADVRTAAAAPLPTSGIGYAIPIDYAREVALELIKNGKAVHGSLDAQGRTAQAGPPGRRLPRAGAPEGRRRQGRAAERRRGHRGRRQADPQLRPADRGRPAAQAGRQDDGHLLPRRRQTHRDRDARCCVAGVSQPARRSLESCSTSGRWSSSSWPSSR